MSGSGKAKKLTSAELKQHLRKLTQDELIHLIGRLYRSGPEAVRLLNAEFNREQYMAELQEEIKKKIRKEFSPKRRTDRLSLREAKAEMDAFQKLGADAEQILDLQLFCVECATEFSGKNENLHETFYSGTEKMLAAVLETIRQADDETLFRRFENRLRRMIKDTEHDPEFRNDFLTFQNLKWVKENQSVNDPETDDSSGPTLSAENAKRFFELMMPLESWINRKYKINPELGDMFTQTEVSMSDVHKLMNALWSHSDAIDAYLAECGETLSGADREIISGWKHFVRGRFVIERYLKAGSVFISTEQTAQVYLVSGITSEIEENIPRSALPVMVEATLIPFMGRVIYDGLLIPYSVYFAGGIRQELKEIYMNAKRKKQIIYKYKL